MANVQILKVAHAFVAGTRGTNGGAPSKDSVFGVALIQGNVVSFGGRRGGVLRYKTYKKADLDQVMIKFASKLTGNPFGKHVDATYTEVDVAAYETLLPNIEAFISKGFYTAMSHKKLNTRSTKKPVAAK